ncbi:hypothetical protein NG861_09410 [Enterococcus faecalis]|uniref:hypothetical protein n=1 Tax=Enterococcus faecalis TaxID=1351 RepID=UPI0020912B72|nr:hypothetical protein [Enterococcus faecalis]MCO5488568.1 hypothetical protein [Enterococcus faecalis]HDT8180728.1 hypothetical protein [Enterococcus faecalis]HDV0787835.1 hypothetical protein [Enterococcus faecalis]
MKNTITKNNQPIKEITQQDIHELRDYLEQLASWQEPLKQIHTFFDNQEIPLNKKKIIREFHAQAKVFDVFYENFILSMGTLEEKVTNLEGK